MNAPRYRLDRIVGRGRHASLWLASDLQRRASVALKVAPRGSLRDELDALRALACDQVVRVHDGGLLPDGRPFIAMDYLTEGHLAGADASPTNAAAMLRGAARALAAVHRQGWVHRDIKPAHLLRRGGQALALCDFGSASRAGRREPGRALRVIGTPRYAAPEQTEGAPAAATADVYSLGVCAFELLAGKPPFQGETLTELFSQHVHAPVPRLPRETLHWQPLIDALLAKDPAHRPADGDAVLARLAPLTGDVS